jgi:hypothetical protein
LEEDLGEANKVTSKEDNFVSMSILAKRANVVGEWGSYIGHYVAFVSNNPCESTKHCLVNTFTMHRCNALLKYLRNIKEILHVAGMDPDCRMDWSGSEKQIPIISSSSSKYVFSLIHGSCFSIIKYRKISLMMSMIMDISS